MAIVKTNMARTISILISGLEIIKIEKIISPSPTAGISMDEVANFSLPVMAGDWKASIPT